MPPQKRKACKVHWLLGAVAKEFSYNVDLPRVHEVLRVFLWHHSQSCDNLKRVKTVRESAHATLAAIEERWRARKINTLRQRKISVGKLEALYAKYKRLNKDRQVAGGHGGGEPHRRRLAEFVETMYELFDISCPTALDSIQCEETRRFLINQRSIQGRRCALPRQHPKTRRVNKRTRSEVLAQRQRKEAAKREERFQAVNSDLRSSSPPPPRKRICLNESDDEYTPEATASEGEGPSTSKRGRTKIFSLALLAMMDRCKMSARKGAAIAITALGPKAQDAAVNKSTLQRMRVQFRKETDAAVGRTCRIPGPLTIHWDSKLLNDITGEEKVDSLPVVIRGGGQEQLLGVPKLASGSGLNEAVAVTDLVGKNGFDVAAKVKSF